MFDYMNAFYPLNDIEDVTSRALTATGMIAAKGSGISETMFRFYTSSLQVPDEKWVESISFYSGLGLLEVTCDCSDIDKHYCLAVPDAEVYDNALAKHEADDEDSIFVQEWLEEVKASLL